MMMKKMNVNVNDRSVDSMWLSHRALDVQRLDVLPILLEERYEEVDGEGDVGDELILGVLDVAHGDSQAQHLLQLELDSASHHRHLGLHILVGSQQGWELTGFVQARSQDTRALTEH